MDVRTDSALRHFGKVLLLFAVIGVLYSLGLRAVCNVRAESIWSTLGPRAASPQACFAEGWKSALYQPLLWLATGIVFALYDAVTGEIYSKRCEAARATPGAAPRDKGSAD